MPRRCVHDYNVFKWYSLSRVLRTRRLALMRRYRGWRASVGLPCQAGCSYHLDTGSNAPPPHIPCPPVSKCGLMRRAEFCRYVESIRYRCTVRQEIKPCQHDKALQLQILLLIRPFGHRPFRDIILFLTNIWSFLCHFNSFLAGI